MNFTGMVKKINVRQGTGRRGPWSAYSARIEKEDGTEYKDWVSFGFQKPEVEEGKWYSIDTEKDTGGFYKALTGGITAISSPVRSAAPAASNTGHPGQARGSSSSTQSSIHYQSARKDALEFAKLAQSLDALPLIKTAGKAGEAKRYAELLDIVDKLTVQFFYDAETHRLLESVVDAGADVETTEATNDVVSAKADESDED